MDKTPSPLERHILDAARVMTQHPPVLVHPNKRVVYEIACPEGCTHSGQLECTRWRQMPLPVSIDAAGALERVAPRERGYTYKPVLEDAGAVEWYVNFADQNLFFGYGTGLFAQDEIQAAEHPVLGALREALRAGGQEPLTTEDGHATPILIKGAERRCRVRVNADAEEGRPHGLYGNDFASASPEAVRRATTPLDPPTVTNLIAMAAPSGGFGPYERDDIAYALGTAYTGFRAAVLESDGGPAAVHTGFWGCGAFGGNRVLMAMLQVLAAGMAGVDRLVFHTFDDDGKAALDEARTRIQQDLPSDPLGSGALLDGITAMEFEWGLSDGN